MTPRPEGSPPAVGDGAAGPADEIAEVGGQAVVEGVMMRGRRGWSLAVRRPDGSIFIHSEDKPSLPLRRPRLNKPIIRGFFVLVESLAVGWRALAISADVALEGEGEGKGLGGVEKAVTLLLALALAVALFIALPTWLAPRLAGEGSPAWLWNLVEGGLRLLFFLLYLVVIGLSGEMRRIFQYHGAEHQAIHLWEKGLPLQPERAVGEDTAHLRCGTAFVLQVLVLTVVVYSFMGKPALWLRILERVAVIPLIAGVSYEIMKAAERGTSAWWKLLTAPGLALQALTTRRPDLEQAEVALAALRALVEPREGPHEE